MAYKYEEFRRKMGVGAHSVAQNKLIRDVANSKAPGLYAQVGILRDNILGIAASKARRFGSTKAIADRCNLDERTIKRIIAGTTNPLTSTVQKLANGLGATASELLWKDFLK